MSGLFSFCQKGQKEKVHQKIHQIQEKMTEITPEMLDVIEKVKGKRNPALWDVRCEQYLANMKKGTVKKSTTS